MARIVERVRRGGDRELEAISRQIDGAAAPAAPLGRDYLEAALDRIEPGLRDALERAITNIEAVAAAQLTEPSVVLLPQGHRVEIRRVAVGAAAVYVPGGRAPYPSSLLMGAIPARVAGVERVVAATPPAGDGSIADVIAAAAALAGVDSVYPIGGAQAIAALAYGTETIAAVDVIVGPGSPWVQAAKALVCGQVGIDGYAGPSELMVLCDETAPRDWIAADLCAQAEHGEDSPLIVVSTGGDCLAALGEAVEALAAARPGVCDATLSLVEVADEETAIALVNAYAPEHLQIACADAEVLADAVRTAGCVFVGAAAATAFGDYAAGSNHVLPTGGAGRFTGPLGPSAFSRPISLVSVGQTAAANLAETVNTIALAEGFVVHGESAMLRAQ